MILYLIFNYYQMNIFIVIASLIVFVYFYFIMSFYFKYRKVRFGLVSFLIYRRHQLPFLLDWLLDWSSLWKLITLLILRSLIINPFGMLFFWFCCRRSCSRMDTIFRKGNSCRIYFMLICTDCLELLSILCLFGVFSLWSIIMVLIM